MLRDSRPGPAREEASLVDMYTSHPSPGRRDKLAYADHRMDLRLHACGVYREDYRGSRVLDAGCGTGEYACWFASRGAEVTAIDLSPASLEEARAYADRHGLTGASFERRSVLDTGLADESFDLVYCTGVLHHTETPFEGLRELTRVLRPEGKIVISLYHSGGFLLRACRSWMVRVLAGDDLDARVEWGRRLFPLTCRRLTRGDYDDPESPLYDYFAAPIQSCHSVGEGLEWFDRLDLEFRGSFPPARLGDYPPLFAHPAYQSLEEEIRSPVHSFLARFGRDAELGRERPGKLSRALTFLLWTADGLQIFALGARKAPSA